MHLPDLLLSLNSHDKVAVCVGGIGGGHLTNSEGTEALGELTRPKFKVCWRFEVVI